MTKILVTGGAGFIGSNIMDLLIEKDYEVVVVDDLSAGSRENLNENAGFYKTDICDPDLKTIFEKEKPDFVVHQAAQVNVRKSVSDPGFDANVNILGSINLLECCREFEVKKVVYASSGGAVYGEPKYLPADEKHPVNPLCPYGASKYCVENYLFIYWKNFDLDYTVLRYSNVYGPRQDPFGEAGVVAIFTEKLLRDENPVIFGDGEQSRDFVYVGDVANANLLAVEGKTKSREFNIGSGIESSVNEVHEKLRKLTNSRARAVHGEPVLGEVRKTCLDITRARDELGWEPQIGLAEGLDKTVEWIKKKR